MAKKNLTFFFDACVNQFGKASILFAALLLSQGSAKAFLVYNVSESAGNVLVSTSGSLNLAGAISTGSGGATGTTGFFSTNLVKIVTGSSASPQPHYTITGPSSISGTVNSAGSSTTGLFTDLSGFFNHIVVDSSYVSSSPIVSSIIFNGQTLASLGFTTTGLLGTWTLDGTSETIQVVVQPKEVPGPLPLLGAGAAFGWSRRLRKRIATPLSTPPQA